MVIAHNGSHVHLIKNERRFYGSVHSPKETKANFTLGIWGKNYDRTETRKLVLPPVFMVDCDYYMDFSLSNNHNNCRTLLNFALLFFRDALQCLLYYVPEQEIFLYDFSCLVLFTRLKLGKL